MFANTRTDPFWSFWPHSCILAPCVCVSRTLLRCSTLPGSGSRGIRPNLLAQQCMSVSFVCLDAWMQHCTVGVLLLNHDQRALHSPAHPAHPAYPTYSWGACHAPDDRGGAAPLLIRCLIHPMTLCTCACRMLLQSTDREKILFTHLDICIRNKIFFKTLISFSDSHIFMI